MKGPDWGAIVPTLDLVCRVCMVWADFTLSNGALDTSCGVSFMLEDKLGTHLRGAFVFIG